MAAAERAKWDRYVALCREREHLYRRDARKLRQEAAEIVRQVEFYQRNGAGDESRLYLFITNNARRILRVAERVEKRERKAWDRVYGGEA